MSKKKKIILAGCGGLVMLMFIGFAAIFWLLGDVAKAESYEMSGDIVPSVTKVVGYRKVNSYSTKTSGSLSKKTITCVTSDSREDVKNYVAFLAKNEGFKFLDDYEYNAPTGKARLAKESREKGKLLIIEIDYSLGAFTVAVTKGEGTITPKAKEAVEASDTAQ